MKSVLKTILVSCTLTITANAFAYKSDLDCPNMIAANRNVLAARNLVAKDDKETLKKIDNILESIDNALIYRHCDRSEKKEVAKAVTVRIEDSLFYCPVETTTQRLIKTAKVHLDLAITEYGGFRAQASKRAGALSDEMKAEIEADSTCKPAQ